MSILKIKKNLGKFLALAMVGVAAAFLGIINITNAASSYAVTETTATVGTATSLEIEYTVDTAAQTWANGDTLTVTLPDNFPIWSALTFTAEYDTDTTNNSTGETAITQGSGNGQYDHNGARILTIKWNATGWGAPVNGASTIRILITSGANPMYADDTSTFTFGGTTADAGDTNPSGTDDVAVSAADPLASIDVTGVDTVGETGNVVATFAIAYELADNDEVRLTFPANFDVSGATYVSDTVTGDFDACTVASQTVKCAANGGIAAQSAATITISGIKAKYAAAATTYTTVLYDISASANISSAADDAIGATLAATTLTATFDVSAVATVGDASGQVTLALTFPVALETGDTIKMTFPANWNVSTLATGADKAYGLSSNVTVAVASQLVTLTLQGAQAAGADTITFEANTITPYYAATGQTVAILIEKVTSGADVVAASANTGVAKSIDDTVIADAAASITLASGVVGATQNTTLGLTIPVALESGDTVIFTLPANLDVSGVTYVSQSFGGGGNFTCVAASQIVTCTTDGAVTAGTGNIVMSGITGKYVAADQTVTSIAVHDTSGAVDLATDASGTVTNTTAADPASSINVSAIAALGTTGNVVVTLTIPYALADNDELRLTFPANFDVSGATYVSDTFAGSFDACTAALQVVTCTANGSMAAEAGKTVTISGITAAYVAAASTYTTTLYDTSATANIATVADDAIAETTVADAAASIALADASVGATQNTTLTVTIPVALATGGTVAFTAPNNLDVSSAAYVSDTFGGAGAFGCSAALQVVTCTATGAISSGTGGTIVLSGITAKYAKTGQTISSVAVKDASANDLATDASGTVTDTTAATTLTATINASDVITVGDSAGQVTIATTFPVALAAGDTIKLTFPANWNVSGITTGAGQDLGLTNTVTVGVASQVVTLTLGGAQAAGADTITFLTGEITPYYAATSQTVAILIEKTGGEDVVAASADAGVAKSIQDTIAADAGASVALASGVAGATQNTTLSLTLPVALANTDTIAFTFPGNLDVGSVAFSSDTFGGAGAFACADSGQVITCTADGVIDAGAGTIIMTGITPRYAATGATISSVAVYDTSATANLALDASGTITDTTAADPASSINVSAIAAVGSTGNVVVTLSAAYALAEDDELRLTFPANFNVSAAAYSADTFTGDFDACTAALQVVTCTVAAGGIAAGNDKTVTISGITAAYAAAASTYTTTLYDTSASANIATASDDVIAETTVADAAASLALASGVVGATQNTTLTLTTPGALAAGDTVAFTAPNNLDVSSAAYSSDTFGGAGAFACSAAAQVVTCTASGVIDAGAGTIIMTGITAKYAKTGQTISSVAVHDTSAGADIATDASGTVTDTTAATTLTAAFDASAVATVGDASGAVTLGLTFPVALAANDTIKLTFPANWNVANLTTAAGLDNAVTVGVADQVVTLTLGGVQGATAETITFQTDTITPKYVATGQTVAILIEKTGGEDVVAASADAGVTKSINDTVAGDAAAGITLANAAAGATQNTTLAITLPVDLANTDTVVFTMPANLDVGSVAFSSDTFGGAGAFACADSGQVITCTADGVITKGTANIVMSGITAKYAATGQTISSIVVYDTSASANMATDASGTVTDTMAADPVSSIDVSAIAEVNQTGNVVVTFNIPYALADNDELRLTFPSNFNVSGAAYGSDTFTGSFDACTAASQVVTCTANGSMIAESTKTLTISGIVASTTASASTYTTVLYDISAAANIASASDTIAATTPDVTPPTFSSWTLNMNTGHLVMTFNEIVDASSLAPTGITIQDAATKNYAKYTLTGGTTASSDGTSIDIALSTGDLNAIKAEQMLAKGTGSSYLTITSATITDIAGNGVTAVADGAGTQASSYTADATAPTVSSTSPDYTSAQTGVAVTVAPKITFSKVMNPSTLNSTNIYISTNATNDTGKVTASVTPVDGNTAVTITPASSLAAGTAYYLHVTVAVKDANNLAIASQFNGTNSFTTVVATETTPPTVASTSPDHTSAQTGVSRSVVPTITFSEALAPATVIATTAYISTSATDDTGIVAANVTMSNGDKTITITPTSNLAASTAYYLHVTTAVTDVNSNALASQFNGTNSFTTVAVADTTAPTISLTSATPTQTGAAIVFQSTETGTAYIKYGLSAAYGNITESSSVTASSDATITLTGLTCGTTYHYDIYAKDAALNESHNLGDATFTTSACSATAAISGVAPSGITNAAATIAWTTDVTSTSNIVEYGTTPALGTNSSADVNALSHSVSLSSLTANTTYYYRVKSTAGGSVTYSDILSFKTAAAATGVAATAQTLRSYATSDGTYTNGWQFKFNVTINDATETYLKMKFADWTGASALTAASNMKIALTDDIAGVQAGTTGVAVGNLYATQSTSLTLVDEDPSIGGIQDTIYVYVKVPDGTSGGSYSTSYGIKTGTSSSITD
jgi:hypothetical protein